eukprot:TRINITY_DN3357_c0_g2_i1.p1 TRINITY_DN3357_c0_g2~~TRINITY_DN3357_c0_g2_i1.p1  ORF type:complete len:138 (-),score=19.15 TRINITY_DN3357_c0_g2_i1:104-517(-)
MSCPARRTARWLTAAGKNVYLYFFTHVIEEVNLVDPSIGVFHGSELLFVWDVPNGLYDWIIPVVLTGGERKLAHHFVDYWTQFASTGDPNSSSAPVWPKFANASDINLNLDLEITVQTGLKRDVCDWWDTVYLHVHG